ncbi:hypothetical protein KSZ_51620 [Dictyobacter formicarum]|uniref:Uncharacterized protein n=1 Tax=Dictyobacter formicarum TaxID=2778368 RepID=A0ABQ3VN99_9CHLR|nr:hypothetical protein KSZ_51620 [Dictyobacter formicarum]
MRLATGPEADTSSNHQKFGREANMLYAVGELKLAKPLASSRASSYTENKSAGPAQTTSAKGVAYAVNQYPPDQGGYLRAEKGLDLAGRERSALIKPHLERDE